MSDVQFLYCLSCASALTELSCVPGRKEIIAEFKGLVSSFPNKMGTMQSQLRRYKETASGVHSLRADVQFLSSVLDRKVSVCFFFFFFSISFCLVKFLDCNQRTSILFVV